MRPIRSLKKHRAFGGVKQRLELVLALIAALVFILSLLLDPLSG